MTSNTTHNHFQRRQRWGNLKFTSVWQSTSTKNCVNSSEMNDFTGSPNSANLLQHKLMCTTTEVAYIHTGGHIMHWDPR